MQLSFPLLFLKAPQINKFGAIKEEAGEGLGRRDQIDYTYVVAASRPPSSVFEKRRKKHFNNGTQFSTCLQEEEEEEEEEEGSQIKWAINIATPPLLPPPFPAISIFSAGEYGKHIF